MTQTNLQSINATGKLSEAFNESGWSVEHSVLDSDTILQIKTFLEKRLSILESRFNEWIKENIPNNQDKTYGEHQKHIPDYESMDIPQDLRHYLVGEFDLETRLSPILSDFLSSSNCKKTVSDFAQEKDYYVHYPLMVRFKVADAPGNLVPPHQDYGYNEHLADFLTVWVPLVDIDEACGGVIVYEGSHLKQIFNHSASGIWGSKADADLNQFTKKHLDMNAGDFLLFSSTLLHESAPHTSSNTRFSIDFRVFLEKDETSKSFFNPQTNEVTRVN